MELRHFNEKLIEETINNVLQEGYQIRVTNIWTAGTVKINAFRKENY